MIKAREFKVGHIEELLRSVPVIQDLTPEELSTAARVTYTQTLENCIWVYESGSW